VGWNDSVTEFIVYLSKNRRMSEHTCVAYERDLQQFGEYLSSVGINQLDGVKSNHIRWWMSELMEQGIKPRTVNRKLSGLRTFFKYLRQHDMLLNDPMSRVVPPKTAKYLVKDIPRVDLEKMFARFPWEEFDTGERDRLLLLMLYTTGMRLSELIGLKNTDIDFSRNQLRVLGKRNKIRDIPLHPELADTLMAFTKTQSSKWVFSRSNGEPLYPVLVYRVVNKYLKLFSSASKLSPHVLRHSFATHMLNNGANLMAIKDLLGHSSLSATQVYTKSSFEKLKQIHGLHPRK